MNKATSMLKQCYAKCKSNGFIGVRNNLYRCYGDGLLQVIAYPAKCTIQTATSGNNEVYFGVFSLYSKLNWITSGLLSKVLQYDLPVPYEAAPLLVSTGDLPQKEDAVQIVTDAIIPFLNNLFTHTQLSGMLEQYDMIRGSQIIQNDAAKIVPYILSGQYEKAIGSITAIEDQNWDAYIKNCQSIPNYDKEMHKHIIETRLASLIALRNAIYSNNHTAVSAYLLENYQHNSERLKSLGITTQRDDSIVLLP